MPCGPKPCNQLGKVAGHYGSFRASVQYHDAASGRKKSIYGPSRCLQAEAERDLQEIREAAQYNERHRDLIAMVSAASRLKTEKTVLEKDRLLLHLLIMKLQLLRLWPLFG